MGRSSRKIILIEGVIDDGSNFEATFRQAGYPGITLGNTSGKHFRKSEGRFYLQQNLTKKEQGMDIEMAFHLSSLGFYGFELRIFTYVNSIRRYLYLYGCVVPYWSNFNAGCYQNKN